MSTVRSSTWHPHVLSVPSTLPKELSVSPSTAAFSSVSGTSKSTVAPKPESPVRSSLPPTMASLRLPPPQLTSPYQNVEFDDSTGPKIVGSPVKFAKMRGSHLRFLVSTRRKSSLVVSASRDPLELTQEPNRNRLQRTNENNDTYHPFEELKHRFLRFKKENCLDNPMEYHNLAEAQSPKFMVVACADSRVCPSIVLGLQPGEAFTIRNVANIVPPFDHGVSETNAALQFAVNTLKVSNILVVGHSRCGGIQALMNTDNETSRGNFTKDWVSIAKSARLSTKAVVGHLSFEQQCRYCEKESLNGSMLNLLTYPWIEKRVVEGNLFIHGGYYDFVDCTFEKWTLVYKKNMEGGSKYGMRNRTFWS